MSQPSPFSSTRLSYRAIRHPEDLAVFTAINADQTGYQNSNITNIKLPSSADAEKFMKETADKSLLGAIIWLKPSFRKEDLDNSIRGEEEIVDEKCS